MWSKVPSNTSDLCNSVHEFGKCVLSLVNAVRSYDVCKGVSNEKYQYFLKHVQNMEFDENRFKEGQYVTAFRSTSCMKLISLPKLCCKACNIMKHNVDRRVKHLLEGTPNKFTNHRYLVTPELQNKVSRVSKDRKNAERREKRLRLKIRNVLDREGKHIDESLMDTLETLLDSQETKFNDLQKNFGRSR